jgi:hypothetical protein
MGFEQSCVDGLPQGEPHAGERRHTKWGQVRSETMDCDSVAVRTARPDEE